ncbi:MAG: hypothetical protein AVDCRST_MAG45-800 [uncultured Solirubrobacterales bacterium]|uniref:Uncharacterized protein n=1 Tax=uncultured Solirubrobacterales bacterium TaxID=768556 RepID=A0A6J4S867_9ACTN|nr:MAG: hypothetical protein AVDCRST_MAG45-800 [uncultured Solirubrobacterales bacterium]
MLVPPQLAGGRRTAAKLETAARADLADPGQGGAGLGGGPLQGATPLCRRAQQQLEVLPRAGRKGGCVLPRGPGHLRHALGQRKGVELDDHGDAAAHGEVARVGGDAVAQIDHRACAGAGELEASLEPRLRAAMAVQQRRPQLGGEIGLESAEQP